MGLAGNFAFMALAQNIARLSEAEYLRLEREAETRSEYFDGGEWTLKEAAGLDAELKLPSLGIVLHLREVFAKVQFAPARPRTIT